MDSVETWSKFNNFNQLDAAIVHVAYWLEDKFLRVSCEEVITRLSKNCCRILTSGHAINTYLKDALRLGGDYYFQNLFGNDDLKVLLKLGRVDEEQISSRGFSIKAEGGSLYKAEMGIAPDNNMNDDAYYINKAKEGR